ncbi:cation:proton antiporter [Candidatus Pacearchaeota archaeon]|nr:cation:proton antiporter [Candidatus Pacearchaeota archaeon]
MEGLLLEIGVIIGIAAVISLLGRLIKQPPIIAYLLTGVIVGPLVLNLIASTDQLQALASIGIALLLFIIGISLDFRILKHVGGTAVIGGISTVAIVSSAIFFIAQSLGFNIVSALYIALAFSFSSAVVVVKILSDKKEIDTLYGQIALGILIVESFIAALALMIIPVISSGGTLAIGIQIAKFVGLVAGIILFGRYILSGLLRVAAKNQEVLFLVSMAWALVAGLTFELFGSSTEIGALIAGMVIASSKYSLEIRSRVKGIRDFFVILFFVFFGSQLAGPISINLIQQAVIFSLFILLGKPLIVMALTRSFGFKKRTNFMIGSSLTQVSEFSLIVILLGYSLGHIPKTIFSLTILVTLITVSLSSYAIYFSRPIYESISRFLGIFDGKRKEFGGIKKHEKYDIILLGYSRLGFNLLKAFILAKKKYLIVDYNPLTIMNLSKKGISCVYGDVNDSEFLKSLNLSSAKMIISTIPEHSTNLNAMKIIENKNCTFIATSNQIHNAIELYKSGVDYVIMPHYLGGDFMANMLIRDDFNKKTLQEEGKLHIRQLRERMSEPHNI